MGSSPEMCGLRTSQSADQDPQDFFCGRGLTRILFCDECIFS